MMNKKNIKRKIFRTWLTLSDLVYNQVESLPKKIFIGLAITPIFLFWFTFLSHHAYSMQPLAFFDKTLNLESAFLVNFIKFASPVQILIGIVTLHSLTILIFLLLAHSYLSKLVLLWGCWYAGVHPSLFPWFGKPEFIPHLIEGFLFFASIKGILLIHQMQQAFPRKILLAGLITIPWFFVNPWLGVIVTFFTHLHAMQQKFNLITLIGAYGLLQTFVAIFISQPNLLQALHNVYKAIIDIFGLTWIPTNRYILQAGFLIFWIGSLIGMFLHTNKKRQAALLLVVSTAYAVPLFLHHAHPVNLYLVIPVFVAMLGILYENTGSNNIKSVIKSLILPIYASFFFNLIAMLIKTPK